MFTVKGYDSFSHEWWDVGEYKTKEEAKKIAESGGGVMTLMHVYDPDGKHIAKYGSF